VPKRSDTSMASCDSSTYSFQLQIKKSGRDIASKSILRDVSQATYIRDFWDFTER
jgi:hypothetical protein